ncbi:hypothetical protein ACQKWADRAFT_312853 [Trichoderma austrokoningii]
MQSYVDFERDGKWNKKSQTGPAIHTPKDIRDIVVKSYRIEWLDLSEPKFDYYAKNHIVATVVFAASKTIGGVKYRSARLSMEVDEVKIVGELATRPDTKSLRPGSEYMPGVYTVKLLTYQSPTHRAPHHRTYPVRAGLTIGNLINKILERSMHHFLFLGYTNEGRWKGCGDHALHCWAVFVREGDITSRNAEERGARPLGEELMTTYLRTGQSTTELVGRGWWISHNPVQDSLTPEIVFNPSSIFISRQ